MGESKRGAGARRGPNTVVQVFPEGVGRQMSEFCRAPQIMLPGAGLPPPGGGAWFQFMHWCLGVPTWPPLLGHTFFCGVSVESPDLEQTGRDDFCRALSTLSLQWDVSG